jgi:hypothetical protein
MPLNARTDALQVEYDRLRGDRQARLDAKAAHAARLAEIDASPARNDGWSRSELDYWEQRGLRARRRAADEQVQRWQAQLADNEPARRKLAARAGELDERRNALRVKHAADMAKLDAQCAQVNDERVRLEAVPMIEEIAA